MSEATPERRNRLGRWNQRKYGISMKQIKRFIKLVENGKKIHIAGKETGLSTGSAYFHWNKHQERIKND